MDKDKDEAKANHPSRTGSPAASAANLRKEHKHPRGGHSLLDMLAALTGERPVMVKDGFPFVVAQLLPNPEAPDTGYGLEIQAGNVPNRETMAAILVDAVVHMNGLTADDESALLTLVDERRAAAGLRSIVEYGFKDEPDAPEPDAPEPAAAEPAATN